MIGTPSRAWKALSSKVHTQMPLNPRQYQQLFELLKTSFSEQLDERYPRLPHDGGKKRDEPHRVGNSKQCRDYNFDSRTSTSQLLDSVLTNPLLARKPAILKKDSHVGRASPSSAVTLDSNTDLVDSPIAWFEDHISCGTANLQKAQIFLLSIKNQVATLPKHIAQRRLFEAQAGSTVLAWLRNSDIRHLKEFLQSREATDVLVPLLVMEGKSGEIVDWVQLDAIKVANQLGLDRRQVRTWQFNTFSAFMLGKSRMLGKSPVNAFNDSIGAFPALCKTRAFQRYGSVLWKRLVRQDFEHLPTKDSIENFVSNLSKWNAFHQYAQAELNLLVPAFSNATMALKYIQSGRMANEQQKLIRFFTSPSRIVAFLLKTAELLIAEENFVAAQMVLKYTKHEFPESLGEQQDASITKYDKFLDWLRRDGQKSQSVHICPTGG